MKFTWLFLVVLALCGRGPKDVIPGPDPEDSFSCQGRENTPLILELPSYFPPRSLPQDLTEEKFELGRHLFYEKKLSRNNTTSCGSCHIQGLAFTDGLAKGVGLYGDTLRRASMSLSNLLWEDKFFWDSRTLSLEEQALQPIEDHLEMDLTLEEAIERLEEDSLYDELFCKAFGVTEYQPGHIAEAIATFEIAMISSDSKYDRYLRAEEFLSPTEELGRQLFVTHPLPGALRGANCGDCHNPILTNGFLGPNGMKNNGLDEEQDFTDLGFEEVTGNPADRAKFKTTTLRNIELTGPYMHDGRFETLEEVMDHYNEGLNWSPTIDPLMFASNNFDTASLKLGLLPFEIDAVVEFLKCLTDTGFVNDPRFSDPFEATVK